MDDIAREQAIIDGVIEEAVSQYQPREWDPELVRLMETMDWTFDYADRPNSAFYDQRREITRRLHALPLEVAIAFLHVAGNMWSLRLSPAPEPSGFGEGRGLIPKPALRRVFSWALA